MQHRNTDGTWLALGAAAALAGLSMTKLGSGNTGGFVLGDEWQAQDEDGRWYDVQWYPEDKAKLDALLASTLDEAWATYLPRLEAEGPDRINAIMGTSSQDRDTFLDAVFYGVQDGKGGIYDLAGVFTTRSGDDSSKEPFELGLQEQMQELVEAWVQERTPAIHHPAIRRAVERWTRDFRF